MATVLGIAGVGEFLGVSESTIRYILRRGGIYKSTYIISKSPLDANALSDIKSQGLLPIIISDQKPGITRPVYLFIPHPETPDTFILKWEFPNFRACCKFFGQKPGSSSSMYLKRRIWSKELYFGYYVSFEPIFSK